MSFNVNRSGDQSIWEIPEIDGVQRSLEKYLFDDETSDAWFQLINYSTDPSPITEDRIRRIRRLMNLFAEKNTYMQVTLELGASDFDTPQLIRHYEAALNQVTELTGVCRPAPPEA